MTTFILVFIVAFIASIFFAFRRDIKDRKAKISDFVIPLVFALTVSFTNKVVHGIKNYNIDTEKYLVPFNAKRITLNLLPIDTNIHTYENIFKNWKDYFGEVKSSYNLEIKPKKLQENKFVDKYIIVKEYNITYEEDRYENRNKSIEIGYSYIDKKAKYSMYEYEEGNDGKRYSRDEILLDEGSCLDTLRTWEEQEIN
jgi:hypothetical protein